MVHEVKNEVRTLCTQNWRMMGLLVLAKLSAHDDDGNDEYVTYDPDDQLAWV